MSFGISTSVTGCGYKLVKAVSATMSGLQQRSIVNTITTIITIINIIIVIMILIGLGR
jgi:hypothetical protein